MDLRRLGFFAVNRGFGCRGLGLTVLGLGGFGVLGFGFTEFGFRLRIWYKAC